MDPSPLKPCSLVQEPEANEHAPETLRQWVDQRHPKSVRSHSWTRPCRKVIEKDDQTESFDTPRTFFEWVEEIGTIVLILGACFVWLRLILAAFGVCPLF